jgi:hypothetical protein
MIGFIDPPLGKKPPLASAVAQGPMTGFRFDMVQIGSGGTTFAAEQADFDQLRIGTTFESVTPNVFGGNILTGAGRLTTCPRTIAGGGAGMRASGLNSRYPR